MSTPVHTDSSRADAGTIAAIATPAGRGGLGLVRISGPQALAVAQALLDVPEMRPRHAHFARFRDADGAVLDEVVATWFPAPRSATAEDVVEITAHGAPVLLHALLERACSLGARLAEPGEFTRRAFLNGRIDLTQAEAVRDLIEAQTLFQARTAARQMQGSVAAALRPLHRQLTELIARLEAGIDFADDDVTVLDQTRMQTDIEAVLEALAPLRDSFRRGRTVREGLALAIVGRPNVGKSSLFNRLLAQERAIVTAEPGTTRDLIAESLDWDGVPVRLLDTAGIRAPGGEAERLGIEKSWTAAADAELVLALFDASQPLAEEDHRLLERVRDQPQVLLVANKIDLVVRPAAPELAGAVTVSARTGAGMDGLRRAVSERIRPDHGENAEFITNARHAGQLDAAAAALGRAEETARQHLPHEVVLVDLYEALRALDAITGQTTVEDILGIIFSTFCIGK